MGNLIKIDHEYKDWIQSVRQRYRQCQMKASVSVNREMLLFYWSLGRDIVSLQAESKWGSKVLDQISRDLQDAFPNAKGFSTTNLKYMRRFYVLYQNALDENASSEIGAQAVPELSVASENEIGAQAVHQISLNELAMVPWGHHRQIIINSKGDAKKAIFFVRKVIENNWSRGVLMNFLDTDLYERSGKAISNFQLTLPKPQSDLAQEMTRDPYNFDFIAIRENYDEKDLKDALMNQVQDFLMELGTGFAFVGREYRLVVGETEQFIDMLFYNIQEHCYVVVEVKVVDFEPSFIGQLGTYIVAVDRILRKDNNKTVGLLICKTKDNVLAQYATDSSSEPIGVSQYQLSHLLPAEYKRSMPTIEEIEQELSE
ncbi:MAG: DUF1016 family protein [Lachnospiraceae bacterium]|nr:DUF1016 family protein [Lachnospiraceae bacterium]